MNRYNNLNRPGVRSSTTIDPKIVLEDINRNIRRLEPEATPLLSFTGHIGRGPKPKSHKIQVMQYHAFDNVDYCSKVILGKTVAANVARFALLTLDQASRPDTNSAMYYYPQDKMYIAATDQVVEVVMTPDATLQINGSDFSIGTGMTGNTNTRTQDGTVLVKNIEPYPIKVFSTSDMAFLGRTIYESQDIEARSAQRDYIFDCNFVEHKEKVLVFTEDQKNLVMTQGVVPDWTFQQRETISEFKKDVEFNMFWSEREYDATQSGRPKRHMRGLNKTIRTNVSYYDPAAIVDFEAMLSNFMFEQAFRYNPTGTKAKLGLAGGRVLYNFNMAFREYRRTTNLGDIGKKIGLDAESYVIPGGFMLTMMRTEFLRQNTGWEDWMFVIDPALAEVRTVKDFNSRMYQNPNERDVKLMIEWQGTIAWHLEQAHALLRTV